MKTTKIYLKKRKKNLEKREQEKFFSQTYILYDNAGVIKPTFVSELDQYVNVFSRFTIFAKKNNAEHNFFLLDNPRNFFSLLEDNTGEKQFSLSLRN